MVSRSVKLEVLFSPQNIFLPRVYELMAFAGTIEPSGHVLSASKRLAMKSKEIMHNWLV